MLTSIVEAAQFLVFGAVEAFLALYPASVGIPAWQIGIILGAQLLSVIVFNRPWAVCPTASDAGRSSFPASRWASPRRPVPHGQRCLRAHGAQRAVWRGLRDGHFLDHGAGGRVTKDGQLGASVGVLRTIMDIGQTVGPVLTGFLVAAAGYGVAFPALASIIAASAAIFVFLPRPVASAA